MYFKKKITLKNFMLMLCLFIAATTPIFDWSNKIQTMREHESIAVTDDSVYTLSDKSIEGYENFLIDDFGKFKFIAKR